MYLKGLCAVVAGYLTKAMTTVIAQVQHCLIFDLAHEELNNGNASQNP